MEKTIQLHDKTFTIYIKASQIEEAIEKIAQQINEDIGHKKPIFLVILNGAFLFAADLIRKYSGECEVSFVKLSSYYGTLTTTRVREIIGLENDVKGRTVVIVEDIVDTGITMDNIVKKLIGLEKSKLRLCFSNPMLSEKTSKSIIWDSKFPMISLLAMASTTMD